MIHPTSNQSTESISPLRQRFIEDMTMRKLSPKTQTGYIRAVKKLTHFLGRSPDLATSEDLRLFQLHLVETGASHQTINVTITALNFFFGTTLNRKEATASMSKVHQPRKLPAILSVEEVTRLFDAISSAKYKAALAIAYGAGLRASEIANLKVTDIDSKRMAIRVDQGKGNQDRFALLSPKLLEHLRQWWRIGQTEGVMLKGGWLFPGQDPVNPITVRQFNRALKDAVKLAGINKRISMHSLRHSFATHLLEQHVDIRVIQVLLGHKKLETTALYSQVATHVLQETKSPLDNLVVKTVS